MLIFQITLPEEQDADAFATFMRDEYIPGVSMLSTRVGRVTSLTLLQSQTTQHTFFLHAGWGGLPHDGTPDATWRDLPGVDEQLERRFESFGLQVQSFGSFREVATRAKGDSSD